MQLSTKLFARVGKQEITQYTIENDREMSLSFITFGARVQRLRLPSPHHPGGNPNLLLGYVTLQDYLERPGTFGAVLGPDLQDATSHPHNGWQNFNWQGDLQRHGDSATLIMSLRLPDGADGLPGAREVKIAHTLDNDNHWTIDWWIETSEPVALRPTIDLAFALTGDPAQTIMDQQLTLGGKPVEMPVVDRLTKETTATLTAPLWQLALETDAPGLCVSSYPQISAVDNFNGIVGQPHIAAGLRPLVAPDDGALHLQPGEPWRQRTVITLASTL
ncbi:aldose epimerase [Lacticaseibacillus mingshuiensis]|uniref:aldose epimerase n=1 Tax=Lacticaseibacillus mingshuiensis TaxID=2799574 RepID=UPI0019520B7B|nr:aldose epimerase [Lacticaseibacillus mingshuiensis]